MGRGDNRRTRKMLQKNAQRRKKERTKRQVIAAKTGSTAHAAPKSTGVAAQKPAAARKPAAKKS